MPRPLSQRRELGAGRGGLHTPAPWPPRNGSALQSPVPLREALLSPISPTSPRPHHPVQEATRIKVGPITTLPPPPLKLNSSHLWFTAPDLIQHPQLSHSMERNQHF